MYHYIRKMFSKPQNLHKLHRTVSGLDKKHIETGNYIYQEFKHKHLPEMAESMRLLNIFGPGSLHRVKYSTKCPPQHQNFVDIWSGTVWGDIKTPHPPYQKPSYLSPVSKENSPPPSSQKSSSCPPVKSSP